MLIKLPHLHIIEINGADAVAFANAQFTCDMNRISNGQFRPAAWCNPQGQVIATFLMIRLQDRLLLLTPAELLEMLCTRLKLFVLRSAVSIIDRSNHYQCMGVYRDDALNSLVETAGIPVPGNGQVLEVGDRIIANLADISAPRVIVIEPQAGPDSRLTSVNQGSNTVDLSAWRLLDIQSGLPWIDAATTGRFLPQELNLDSLGGLSFNKGCYPGQEIIARVHFRHKLKRRLYLAGLDSSEVPAGGTGIYTDEENASCGNIINAERNPDNSISLLAVINSGHVEGHKLYVHTAGGDASLHVLPLPYPVD